MHRPPRTLGLVLAVIAGLALARCGEDTVAPPDPPADTTPPTIAITFPTEGAVLSTSPRFTASAQDAEGIAELRFRVHARGPGGEVLDDSIVTTSPPISPPFEWLWSIGGEPNGLYAVVATARDPAGNVASDTVGFELGGRDDEPPLVTILEPDHGTIVSEVTRVQVVAVDDSPVDTVRVEIRAVGGSVVHAEVFPEAPYIFDWDTRGLERGFFDICATARDSVGNVSLPVCNQVEVFPLLTFGFDDGEVDTTRAMGFVPWKVAAVFENHLDEPVVIDIVEFFMGANSAITAAFRFVMWNVDGSGAPTTERVGTVTLSTRQPLGEFVIYGPWNVTLGPHEKVAAGALQTTNDPIAIGTDTDSPYLDGVFWFALGEAGVWLPCNMLGDDSVPMIRLYGRAASGRQVQIGTSNGAHGSPTRLGAAPSESGIRY